MARVNFALTSYEGAILWRFFDSVSSAVAMRMLRGSPPGEENLTFLLCELLDESASGLHALEYPLSRVKEDLEKSDAGISVDVGFETHEHTKYFESKYSGADLGIVLSVNHPILGRSRRAVLVQAKKLFANGSSKDFSMYSGYSSYDKDQSAFLKELSGRFDAWNSIFYLWYNPPSSGFYEADAKLIRAYEAHGTTLAPYWGRIHPFLDELVEMGFPIAFGRNAIGPSNQEDEDKAREWRSRQPALRISALDTVLSLTENGGVPRLRPLYEALLARSDRPTFSPFADFFLLALANSRYGSENEQWIQLAEGRKVAMPPLKSSADNKPPSPLEDLEHPPIPRHTIRVTVQSTLKEVG
ncbi:MAG: hypothetical protein ACJ76J_21280 [Thermoanaerobaculia bacterium]